MNILKALFVSCIFLFLSCSDSDGDLFDTLTDDSDRESSVLLDTLSLNQETIDFLSYYEANDLLVFKRMKDESDDTQASPDDIPSEEPDYSGEDYWVFYKETPMTRYYETETSTYEGNWAGKVEKREIVYRDINNFSLTLEASSSAYIWFGEWRVRSQNFIVEYDEDCSTIYLNHRTEGDPNSGKQRTIMVPEQTIGSTTYYDVLKLLTVSNFAHFAFYANQDNRILGIEDLHNEETWVLVE